MHHLRVADSLLVKALSWANKYEHGSFTFLDDSPKELGGGGRGDNTITSFSAPIFL